MRVVVIALRAAGFVTAVLLAAFATLVWQVDSLGRRDEARPADAIVVLGARVNPDGSPGSDLTSRTYHAVDLWQRKIAPHIVCAGGYEGDRLSAAAVCGRFAAELGVPPDRIWLADGASDTSEEASRVAKIMRANRWQSVVLVSHPLHLFRARWLFERAGVRAIISPTNTDTSRIMPPLRVWYAAREAGALLLTVLNDLDVVPNDVIAGFQDWSAELP